MKKRILSVVILALCLLSVFLFASCGKKEEPISCPIEKCDGVLKEAEFDNLYLCDKNPEHNAKLCISEDCGEPISDLFAKFCPSCGASQVECPSCKDNEIEGVYCADCGRQVQKNQDIMGIFGKPWAEREKAISDSALILCFGMLGIFIVTGVIITFILVLNTVVEKARQSKENKQ